MVAFAYVIVSLFMFTTLELTGAETYECTIENYGPEKHQHCVFRNVRYNHTSGSVMFKAPTNNKQPRIVFEDSEMEHLPKAFLETFGNDLKVLIVSKCKLKSVVITNALEELYAVDNYISKVIVHQTQKNSPLKEIHLQSNRLKDISNITRACKNARIIDLSRNQELAQESVIDLSMFNGFNQLEYLLLGDVGAFYLNYDRKVTLPALTLLDLSMNTLLPSDLRLDYLHTLEKLEVLRLNDNGMTELDYAHFIDMKSLKEVYLEGNSFDCQYLKTMVKFLEDNSIATPVARPANNCEAGFMIEHDMCCKSSALSSIPKPNTARPLVPTATSYPSAANTPVFNEVDTNRVDGGAGTVTVTVKSETKSENGVTNQRVNLLFILTGIVAALMLRD
ncbi:uncharacterized protein LOC129723727 isoform X2 [Wyeomyia smithii]|nr:uncharacterized protein LOC129723727 isoform X2 [Wyeomyia smithii]